MERNDREGRDAAGIGPYAREREQLVALSTLGSWTVSEGEPDIRGWEVRTVSGRQLGTVADLLVDEKAGEVVLLDVDLPATDRHTFVPIRVVQIDRGKRTIFMDSADLPLDGVTRGSSGASSEGAGGGGTGGTGGTGSGGGTVRYPRPDREVEVSRPAIPDDMQAGSRGMDPAVSADPADPAAAAAAAAAERRRGERRRIERVNSEF